MTKSLPFLVIFATVACASCIELSVASSTGTSSSGTSSSGMGGQGNEGGFGGNNGTAGSGGTAIDFKCDAQDPTLLACYPFDGELFDMAGAPNATSGFGFGFADGVSGQAMSFDGIAASVAIDESPSWQFSQYTAELWYYQRSYSASRMGLFDSENRFGIFVEGQGELQCKRGIGYFISATGQPLNTWIHVACTFDGSALRMYVNGAFFAMMMAPPISSGGPIAIGANAPSGDLFDGLIDNLRLWTVVRTPAQICESAGGQGC